MKLKKKQYNKFVLANIDSICFFNLVLTLDIERCSELKYCIGFDLFRVFL